MTMRRFSKGSTEILAAIAATVAAGIVLYSVATLTKATSSVATQDLETVVADAYASELLELFRSETPTGFEAHLITNPVNSSLGAYPLCAQINIADTSTSGNILNRDPLADIVSAPITSGSSTLLPPYREIATATGPGQNLPNRFYQAQVVDMTTLQVDTSYCGQTITPTFSLGTNETYLVTVGVTWNSVTQNKIRSVVVSDVLPLATYTAPSPPQTCQIYNMNLFWNCSYPGTGYLNITQTQLILPSDASNISATLSGYCVDDSGAIITLNGTSILNDHTQSYGASCNGASVDLSSILQAGTNTFAGEFWNDPSGAQCAELSLQINGTYTSSNCASYSPTPPLSCTTGTKVWAPQVGSGYCAAS